MKKTLIFLLMLIWFPMWNNIKAGNEDRAGEAGAGELLILPYPRANGWGLSNTAVIKGVEAMHLNVAGIAFTKSTELLFANTTWLKGSGIQVNAFGFTQKLSEFNYLGLSVMSITFGNIPITRVDVPEGGIGNFRPSFLNVGMAYSRSFNNKIYGGILVRVINEAISDNSAQGIALDAGLKYVTGKNENIHFGISLRNIGPPMRFKGDGLTGRGNFQNSDVSLTIENRSVAFQLPVVLNIGAAYDFIIDPDPINPHVLTVTANFLSNAFGKDGFSAGFEYNFKNLFLLHAGYTYEQGMWDVSTRTTAFTGPTAGLTIQVPLNKEKQSFIALDYAYRASNPFDGTHVFGIKLDLGNPTPKGSKKK
ncbi:MAG: PorV/PorQ family protein [Bacteroidales bacterium]|nr:PorV/PorQ family protein [Bacteroidales bacterium]